MLTVAFGHRQRVGKDTATRFLIQHLRMSGNKGRIERGSLAYELKLQCYKLFGWAGLKHPDHYETESGALEREIILPQIGKTPRQIWIEYGIGVCGIYDNALLESLFDACKEVDTLIISDLRRPCEANRIHDRSGFCIRIDRPDVPKSNDIIDMAMASYEDWDAIIVNDGDLNKLMKEVVRVCTQLNLAK